MQNVLSSDLWKTVRVQARKARQRKAAIAYVTRDLVGFRKEDVLIVDASAGAIASGETDARLLRKLGRKQVRLFHCADLHAKVILLDDTAVISSGNMSNSSAECLVEAAVLTDHASTVAGVASFIEQVIHQSQQLDEEHIDRLCRIKVIRRGGRGLAKGRHRRKTSLARLGNRTWLVGVHELARDPAPDEKKMIEKAMKTVRQRLNKPDEEPNWIRWSVKGSFVRECREGDSLIQIWRSRHAKRPSAVLRAAPVLLKQQPKSKSWTRFYLPQANGKHAEMHWGKFRHLLKSLGYSRRVAPGIVHLLENDMADAIDRRWAVTAK
jgi:hypothetical protein